MARWMVLLIVMVAMAAGAVPLRGAPANESSGIDRISAYAGTWTIETEHLDTPYSKASHERTTLRNDCWRSGEYYACNQYVDGESKVLLVFTFQAADQSYTSYQVPADGKEPGMGKLRIEGNVWTFPWETREGDKTTYFRVVNVFTTSAKIEYRQEFSPDKIKWTLMARGVESRIASPLK